MNNGIATVVVIVALLLFAPPSLLSGPLAGDLEREKVRAELERDIQIVNLVNALYLSKEQVGRLLPLIREGSSLHDRYESAKALQQREMIAVYGELREALLKRAEPPYELSMRYYREHDKEKKLDESYRAERKELIARAKEILTGNQMVITQEYTPCLIPARSLVNPERIGQVGNSTDLERMLREMRSLNVPLESFLRMKKRFIDGARTKLEEKMPAQEIAAELARMDTVLEKARMLSDVDFELQKDDIISQLNPKEPPVRHTSVLDGHIDRFIMDERAIPVLLRITEKVESGEK